MRQRHHFGWILAALLLAGLCVSAEAQREEKPRTPAEKLRDSVSANDIARVRSLLKMGVRFDPPPPNYAPLIVEAAMYRRDTEILRLLVEAGADINATDSQGDTPLMAAAQARDDSFSGTASLLPYFRFLLDHGADIRRKNSRGETALSLAMKPGRSEAVRLLLDRGADPNEPGPLGYTPLIYAAFANDTARVRELLKAGADVNAPDRFGAPPLFWAADSGSVETLRALLEAGAKIDARGQWWWWGNCTALLAAIRAEDPDAALFLVQRGANLNLPEEHNGLQATPLSVAFHVSIFTSRARGGYAAEVQHRKRFAEVINALLEKGADTNAVSNRADTPYSIPLAAAIHLELSRGMEPSNDWVRKLLDRGADVNARVRYYGTPLFLTIGSDRKSLDIPELLIERGADINALNDSKLSVLHCAVKDRDFALARLLIERGAKVENRDEAGKTPLLWAAYYGQGDLVELLLARGADLQTQDKLGQSALMLAEKGKHPDVAALLRQKGAKRLALPSPMRNARGQIVARLPLKLRGAIPPGAVTFAVSGQENDRYSNTPPALLLKQGERLLADPVRFGSLFSGTQLWSLDERNDIASQLQRGYYSEGAYRFFGLVTLRGETYLGLFWYSPAASMQHQITHFVFRLRVVGNALELTVVRRGQPTRYDLTCYSKIPSLVKSPKGEMILTEATGRYRYQPDGTWKQIGPPPKLESSGYSPARLSAFSKPAE